MQNPQIHICPYKETDKEQVLQLIKLSIPTYFAPSEEKQFVEYIEKYKEDYFVCQDKNTNQLIGCGGINYFFNNYYKNVLISFARLSWDIIHPDFQGIGIGKKLVEYRINHIKAKNNLNNLINPTSKIELLVVRTSQLAYKFYQKMGFELEKTEKDFWEKGFDLYELKMDL